MRENRPKIFGENYHEAEAAVKPEILLLGAWQKIRYEMLWPRIGGFRQFEERQTRGRLLGRLAGAAFRFGLDVHVLIVKSDLDSKGRVVGRASPLKQSVDR